MKPWRRLEQIESAERAKLKKKNARMKKIWKEMGILFKFNRRDEMNQTRAENNKTDQVCEIGEFSVTSEKKWKVAAE